MIDSVVLDDDAAQVLQGVDQVLAALWVGVRVADELAEADGGQGEGRGRAAGGEFEEGFEF